MQNKIYYETNFENMLLRRHCKVWFFNHSGEIHQDKYSLDKGCYLTKYSDGRVVPKINNFPNPEFSARHDDGNGNFRLNMNLKSIRYHQYLTRCRQLFEMEIKNNVLSMPDPKYIKVYLNEIYNRYQVRQLGFKIRYDFDKLKIEKKISPIILDQFFEENEINYADLDETSTLLNNIKFQYPIYLKTKPNPDFPREKLDKRTLSDIWNLEINKNKNSYDSLIMNLKKNGFLTEGSDKLQWNLPQGKSRPKLHLKALLFVLLDKKWIHNTYSGSDFKKILCNTFHHIPVFKDSYLSSVLSNPPDPKYTDCFKFVSTQN